MEPFFRNRDAMDRLADPLKAAADAPTITGPSDGAATTTIGPTVRYFGDYELLAEIARGGMGVVYKARQVNLNRIVALKMILAGQLANESDVKRFYAEAEAAARLDHPGIVPIFEIGQHDGQHYFSMAFVEGESLAKKVAGGPLPPREAAELLKMIAEAVEFAHQKGIIHRDLKPANVLLDGAGQPRVTDFGLAKQMQRDSGMTGTGQVLGTPSYMPPEQASGKIDQIGPQSDVYALGAILYCLLAGRPPFQAASPLDTLMHVLEREPVSVRLLNAQVPTDLETIAIKCLEKDPSRRYASARQLHEELERFLKGEPIRARPAGMVERSWKWVRRKPLQAAVIALLVGSPTVIVTFLLLADRQVREQQLTAKVATTARDTAVEVAKTIRYAQAAAVVERTLDYGDPYVAEKRLTTMDAELRGWEWNALYRRTRAELQFLDAPPKIEKLGQFETSRPSALSRVTLLPGWPDVAAFRKYGVGGDGYPGELVFWDSRLGTIIRSHSGVYEPFAVSSDGQRFASPEAFNGAVAIRDLESGRVEATLPHSGEYLQTLAFSPDGKLLAVGVGSEGKENAVVLWDVATRTSICRCAGHRAPVVLLAFSPDGRQLAAASRTDDDLILWDTRNGQEAMRFDHAGKIDALAFSPRGDLLASTDGKRIVFWDVTTGAARKTIARQEGRSTDDHLKIGWGPDHVVAIAFSPDGRWLATGGLSGTERGTTGIGGPPEGSVRLWEVDTGRQVLLLRGQIGTPLRLFFSPDGRRLAWSRSDDRLTVCDFERLQTGMTLRGGGPVAVSPDGQLAACCDGRVHIFDTRNGRLVRRPMGDAISGRPLGVGFSHDGKRVAGGLVGGSWGVPIWDLATGQTVVTLKGTSSAYGIAFSPDDRLVILAASHSVRVCDAVTGQMVFETNTQNGTVYCGAFSADGKRLATGGLHRKGHTDVPDESPGEVTIWDVATWQPLRHIGGLYSGATGVAWNPEGTLVAACAGKPFDHGSGRGNLNPNVVLVWDAETGEERLRLDGHAADVNAVMFTPDGRRLLTASADRTVKLWDVKLGLEVMTLRRATAPIVALSASRDGSVLAAGGELNIPSTAPKNQFWLWRAPPLEPAPEGRRYPFWEADAGWDVEYMLAELARPWAQLKAPQDSSSAMTPDLSTYVVPSGTNAVAVYKAETGSLHRELGGLKNPVTALAVSDGGLVAAVANGPFQRVQHEYDPKTGQTRRTVSGEDGAGEVIVWDLSEALVRSIFRGHTQPVSDIAVSPDGWTVASASGKETILYLWDTATGEKRTAIEGHYRALVFAADGQHVMAIRSARPDHQPTNDTVIFDVQTGEVAYVVPNPPGGITQHRLSSDGSKIIRYGPKEAGLWGPLEPSQVQVVDVKTGQVEQVLVEPKGLIRAAAFGPGPGQLTTVSGNQVVRVWDLTTGRALQIYDHGEFDLQRAFLSADGRRMGFYSYVGGAFRIWNLDRLSTLAD